MGILGQIAVVASARKQGIGGQVVRQLEQCAVAAGVQRLIVHPHAYLESFIPLWATKPASSAWKVNSY